MYPTTSAYKQAVKEKSREWRLKIQTLLDSGEVIDFTNDDITMGTFSYDESSICSDNLDIGATYANGVEFSLNNTDNLHSEKVFSYAKLTVWAGLKLDEDTWEDIPMGNFTVIEEGKKLSTIPIKALDWMCLLNEKIEALSILPESSPRDIIFLMEKRYGFSLEPNTDNLLESLDMVLPFFKEDISCRDFVGYAAAALGKSARFNRDGELEFFHVSDTVYETDSNIRTELTLSDALIAPTKVIIIDANGEQYPRPKGDDTDPPENSGENGWEESSETSDDYVIEVARNPLLINDEITELAHTNAYIALTTTPYSPFVCKVISDPSIQCGDKIQHLDKQAPYIDSVITGFKFNFRGVSTLEAKGKSPQSSRQLTATAKKIIEARVQAAKDLNDGITGLERIMINQNDLMSQSLGFYTYAEYDQDGRRILYLMDNEDINKAEVVWRITGNSISVSSTGKDGEYKSSWSANDTFIAKTIAASTVIADCLLAGDNKLKINLNEGKLTTATDYGICEIEGNQMLFRYMDPVTEKEVSFLRITADAEQQDNTADMRIILSSQDGSVSSSISQNFEYDSNGKPTIKEPLKISSTEGVVIDKDLTVLDSILYDNIKMQRKNTEYGNTGVDFVFSPRPFVPPPNLFKSGHNPGFETGTFSPWVPIGQDNIYNIVNTANFAHSGSYCLSGNAAKYLEFPPISLPQTMYLGFFFKTSAGSLMDRGILRNQASMTLYNYPFPTVQNEWMLYSCIISIDPAVTTSLRLYSSAANSLYFDDFYMCDASNVSKELLDDYINSLY